MTNDVCVPRCRGHRVVAAKVSVVIVTIGAKNYIQSCLDSIVKQVRLPDEVIVIDNSTQTGLTERMGRIFPSVKIYPGEQNLSYGAGLDKGIDLSCGEFIICLNDDLVLDRNFILEALKGFLKNKKVGAVSGKILRSNAKILDSTGLFLTAWRTARERGYAESDHGQFKKSGFIFGASGSAGFYRRKMLEEIKGNNGYFDSRFRMFYEDLDLCWRAQRRGWRAYYVPSALAYHVRGGSFRPDSGVDKPVARRYLNEELHYELIKNRYLAILNNETLAGYILHFIPILLYDFCVWAYIAIFQPNFIKFIFGKLMGRSRPEKKSF